MRSIPPNTCGIYKITNLIDGKCYIGQSVDIRNRWKSHRHNGKTSHNAYLRRAMRKHGTDNFSIDVLEVCSVDDLDAIEKKCIASENSMVPSGYNMDLGGTVRKTMGPETRTKRRLASLGANNPNYGKPKSAAFKRIVAAARSKPINQYTVDGKYINTFKNARSVPGFPGGFKNISLCCTGKTQAAYGYQWRFADGKTNDIAPIDSPRAANNVPVSQYDLDGTCIATYQTMKEASKKTGAGYKSISACCNGNRQRAGGFIWRRAE